MKNTETNQVEAIDKPETSNPRAKVYAAGSYRVYFLSLALSAVSMGVVILWLSPWVADMTRGATIHSYLQLALYVVLLHVFLTLIGWPLSFYTGYVREHRYQLSNQTVAGWLWESGKAFALSGVFIILSAAALYWTLGAFSGLWWLVLVAIWQFFSLVLARLAPILILPLFYKTAPLENGALSERLGRLAQEAGLRISGLFTINLSKNTKKLNAALTGLGRSRRVLLGDTLLEKMNEDEITVVFAHEVGHHARRHIPRLIVVQSVASIAALFLCSLAVGGLCAALEIESIASLETLPVVALVLGAMGVLTRPFFLAYSRRLEVESDRYALEKTGLSGAFVSCMKKLASENLADESPSRLAEWFFYSHPPIAKRIALAK